MHDDKEKDKNKIKQRRIFVEDKTKEPDNPFS